MSNVRATAARTYSHPDADYAELKRLIKDRGLLDKQPAYYTMKILLTLALFALSFVILFTVDNFWVQLLNAVYLGIMSTQIGFLGHDAGHRQIFDDTRKNDLVGLLGGNLLLGMSRFWWVNKHNAHHSNPNVDDMDPDIDIPVLAFTEEDALSKRGLFRHLVRYQAYYLIPITSLQALGMHNITFQTVFGKRPKGWQTEATLLLAHFALYFLAVFSALPFWQAIAFILVHKMTFGIYNSSVFAPNHKGMPVLPKDNHVDFLRKQVLTSRNIIAHPVTDFWYGGLNYQIEHHLFPSMPRNRLREAQPIVVDFCRRKGISYHETSVLQSYREILEHLHEVSAPLRAESIAPTAAK